MKQRLWHLKNLDLSKKKIKNNKRVFKIILDRKRCLVSWQSSRALLLQLWSNKSLRIMLLKKSSSIQTTKSLKNYYQNKRSQKSKKKTKMKIIRMKVMKRTMIQVQILKLQKISRLVPFPSKAWLKKRKKHTNRESRRKKERKGKIRWANMIKRRLYQKESIID